MLRGDARGHALQQERRAGRARGMVRRLPFLVVDDHELVADDLVHFAAGGLHERDEALEVRVEHRRHLGRVLSFRVGGEAAQVGEHDAHVLCAGERLVEVERAEALLVPLGSRDVADHEERAEHEHVPFPPRELPVARPGDDDHRLGEERERQHEREHEAGRPPPVEAEEAERRERVERDADRREHELPPVQPFGGKRVVERRKLGERHDRPRDHEPEDDREQDSRVSDDSGRARWPQLRRRGGCEDAGEEEAYRRRDLEARVLAEQDTRCRESVQAEKARARDERKRDEEETGVPPPPCGDADRVSEGCRDRGRGEHEPEVRGLVLPSLVDGRPRQQEPEQHERSGDQHEPGGSAHDRPGVRLQPDPVARLGHVEDLTPGSG